MPATRPITPGETTETETGTESRAASLSSVGRAGLAPRGIRRGSDRYFLVSGEAIVFCNRPKDEHRRPSIARGGSSNSARKLFATLNPFGPRRESAGTVPTPTDRRLSNQKTPHPRAAAVEPAPPDAAGAPPPKLHKLRESMRHLRSSMSLRKIPPGVEELHPDIAQKMVAHVAKPKGRKSLAYVTPLREALEDPQIDVEKKARRKSIAKLKEQEDKEETARKAMEPVFICKLKAGACFGEMALQQANPVRNASVMTISFCDLYYLEAAEYHSIIETDHGSVFKSIMEKLAKKRLEAKREKTIQAQSGDSGPKEHLHLLKNRTESSQRLRDDLVDRMGANNRKTRRSGTALEVKRRASNSGLPGVSPQAPPRPTARKSANA